jgi:hypothetical protein
LTWNYKYVMEPYLLAGATRTRLPLVRDFCKLGHFEINDLQTIFLGLSYLSVQLTEVRRRVPHSVPCPPFQNRAWAQYGARLPTTPAWVPFQQPILGVKKPNNFTQPPCISCTPAICRKAEGGALPRLWLDELGEPALGPHELP